MNDLIKTKDKNIKTNSTSNRFFIMKKSIKKAVIVLVTIIISGLFFYVIICIIMRVFNYNNIFYALAKGKNKEELQERASQSPNKKPTSSPSSSNIKGQKAAKNPSLASKGSRKSYSTPSYNWVKDSRSGLEGTRNTPQGGIFKPSTIRNYINTTVDVVRSHNGQEILGDFPKPLMPSSGLTELSEGVGTGIVIGLLLGFSAYFVNEIYDFYSKPKPKRK